MAGNVWEWVDDWYSSDYYQNSPEENPTGSATDDYRALRGGSWDDDDRHTRTAYRDYNYPLSRSYRIGFRVVELLSDPEP